jgi:hypothetical protein
VHVDSERGRWRVAGEHPLIARRLKKAARREVAGRFQLLEILEEEGVVTVVTGRSRADAFKKRGVEIHP